MTVRIATIAYNHDVEVAIASDVSERADVDLVMRCVDRAEVLAVLRGADLDALLCVGVPQWLDAQLMDEARRAQVRVFGIAGDPLEAEELRVHGGVLLEPGAGLDALLVENQTTPPLAALHSPAGDAGKLIAVWGPKGAPGRTTVAIELAAELAAVEPRTILVDGDTYGGDIAQMLAIVEELPTIVWAAQNAATNRLTEALLEANLRRAGASGPTILPGVPRADLWPEISEFGWKRLLQELARLFGHVVCDVGFCLQAPSGPGGHDRDAVARATLIAADRTVAVCRADPVGIKSFLWAMEDVRQLVDLDNVIVVANRVRAGEEHEVSYVLRKHLGKRPRIALRDRPSDAAHATASGMPLRDLKPSSEAAAAIRDLAAALGANVPARGFLTRLGARR